MIVLENHIGGRRRPGPAEVGVEVFAPATGRRIARIPRSGEAEVAEAVEAAARAAERWAAVPAPERAELLDAVAAAIEERADRFAELESLDTGKPRALAARMDIARAVANFRFFAGAIRHDATEAHPMAHALNVTLRRPLGVVGLITPWNLPLYLLSWKVAPALAMGNAVVAKPSELTPLTADALATVFDDLEAPPGLFNLVHGLGPEAGGPLTVHPDVAAISFTGGTATGRTVAARAAPLFKKLSLELGGKNPTLVFADADFEAAVEGAARAAFTNQGEICLCGSRILVEEAIHDRFVEALVARARALRTGDPDHPDTDVGALISADHHRKVLGYVDLARREGGEIRCGGQPPDLPPPLDGGWYLLPTVVTGLPPTCRTATEEIFGPLVSVHPFRDEEEAIALANGTRYGLSASLWTRDVSRAIRVSAALDTGMVWVNTWLLRDLRVPFGGSRDSGVGREGGRWSLEFYSEARNVCIHLGAGAIPGA